MNTEFDGKHAVREPANEEDERKAQAYALLNRPSPPF
jgi:hypothetical protein